VVVLKVIYFHQHFCTPKGSTGTRSYSMSKRLLQRGHSVTVVCGSFVGADTGLEGPFKNGLRRGLVDGIDVIELDLSYGNSDGFFKRTSVMFRYFIRAVGLVFTEKYDLVFATSTPLTAGIPGIVARWFRGKPFVFEVRDLWPELPKAMGVINNPLILSLMSALEWMSYHSANHVVALSPGIADGIQRRGVSKNGITLIPNGCDFDIFGSKVAGWKPKECRPGEFVALFSGTHGVANNLDSIIDAASELRIRRRGDIKIILVGQGGKKQHLMDRVRNEGLDNIIFHNPVSKLKLAGLMISTDIGLQVLANIPAFYYGTSPNKFFDYISAGLPVLNNYPGWLADMIKANNCGFVVEPESASQFADALEKAADNKKLMSIMGSNSTFLAKNEFNRDDLADKWVICMECTYLNHRG
jgi:glycosyltransferase involved in cell wall biosynthesis